MQDKKTEIKELLNKYRKDSVVVTAVVVVTILMIGGLVYLPNIAVSNRGGTYVPDEFSDARIRAGDAADRITVITDTYKDSIEAISNADRNGNYTEGLALIVEEADKNEEVRQAAEDLSEELAEMARYIDLVGPREATAIALNAVTTGIELVQNLISYNNNTRELLGAIRTRLRNEGGEETKIKIEELIAEMNKEAGIINSLGGDYRGLMIQFDELTN